MRLDGSGFDGWGSSGLSNASGGASWSSSLLGEVTSLADTAVLGEVEVERAVVPGAGEEEEGEGGDGDEEDIEDTEEDEAGGLADGVAAVRHTPGDGVDEPEEDSPAGETPEVSADVEAAGGEGAAVEERTPEEELSKEAESEESPLVGGLDVGSSEPGSNPGPDEGNVVDDGSPGDAREEAEGDHERSPADKPVDVASIEDLSGAWVTSELINLENWNTGDVRGLGVVGDGADEEGDDEEVVEDTLAILGEELEADDTEEDEEVEGGHSPEPVGASSGEVVIGSGRVDLEGVVGTGN